MDAATLTIDLDKRRCCYCVSSRTRCFTDSCPCYQAGRQCQVQCESTLWSRDCLNKPIVQCRCSQMYNVTNIRGKPEIIFCNQDANCPCYRYNENCTTNCVCVGECSNIPGHDQSGVDYDRFPKLDRPLCGCSCSGRGGCKKFKKCLCLQSLSYCGMGCKCKRECTNTKTHFELSKTSKNSLFDPEECQSGSLAILHIIGVGYGFQLEFATPNLSLIHAEEILCRIVLRTLSVYSIPIQHVIVSVPNSPCFHQDCQPACEMVDQCGNGRSCATALGIFYSQLRKVLRNTQVQMTVRFLNPYMARGDLYTKRAILALMESGIRVEPITIKDWADLMRDSVYKLKKRSLSMDRLLHQSKERDSTPNSSSYYTLWNIADMDRFVRLSQHYINECRRTLGFDQCYWTSPFHDVLKMAVLTCAGASEKLKHISVHLCPPISSSTATGSLESARDKRLTQMKRQSRQTTSEDDGNTVASSTSSSFKKKHRIRCNSGPGSFKNYKFRTVDETTESRSRSSKELDADISFKAGTSKNGEPPETNGLVDSNESTLITPGPGGQKLVNIFSSSVASSSTHSLQTPAAAVADKILLNLSGRNMAEAEQQEIKDEMASAIESIQQRLNALMNYLDQKTADTAV